MTAKISWGSTKVIDGTNSESKNSKKDFKG